MENLQSSNLPQRRSSRVLSNSNGATSTMPESHFCSFCGSTFDEESPFRQHMDGHFRKRSHECDVCNSSFSGPYFLKRHMDVHVRARPFVCSQCGTGYRKKEALIKHFRIHGVPQLDFPAEELHHQNTAEPSGTTAMSGPRAVANQNTSMDKNARIGMNSNQANSGLTQTNYNRHVSGPTLESVPGWTPQNPMNGGFMSQASLQNPLTHPNLQEMPLTIRGVEFGGQIPIPPNIQSFQRPCSSAGAIPGKEKKVYPCLICDKTFTIKAHILRHNRLHTGEKPFECRVCKRRFMWKSSLATHKCSWPSKAGKDKKSITMGGFWDQDQAQGWSEQIEEHNATKESSQDNLDDRPGHGVSEANGETEENGNTTRMFMCGQCGEKFTTESLLQLHMSIHNDGLPDVAPRKPHSQEGRMIPPSREGESTVLSSLRSRSLVPKKDERSNPQSHTSKEMGPEQQDPKKWKLNWRARVVLPKFPIKRKNLGNTSHHGNAKEKPTKVLVCEFCSKVFLNWNHYNRHMRIHTGETPFECDKCERKFRWKSSLESHIIAHKRSYRTAVESNELVKGDSGWTPDQRDSGQMDSDQRDSDQTFICVQCGLNFGSELELQCHALIHDDSVLATVSALDGVVDQSGTGGGTEGDLPSGPYHLKTFETENRDINPEMGEVPESQDQGFTCDVCSKVFHKHPVYLRHLRIHSGELPFQCDQCNMRFKWRSSLDVHKETHNVSSSLDPFADAGNFGDLSTEQQEHVPSENETEASQAFECVICGIDFPSETDLEFHKSIHEDIKFEPETILGVVTDVIGCSSEEPDELEQDSAVQSPENPPTITPLTETTSSTLGMVEDVKPQNFDLFVCEVCRKAFGTKRHYVRHKRIHTEEMPYQCNLCDRSFKWSSSLYAHKRSHANKDASSKQTSSIETSSKESFSIDFTLKKSPSKRTSEETSSKDASSSNYLTHFYNEVMRERSEGNPDVKFNRINASHDIPKPFVCPQCGECFVNDSQLQMHMFVHGDEEYLQSTHTSSERHTPPGTPSHQNLLDEYVNIVLRSNIDSASSPTETSPERKHDINKRTFTCEVCGKGFKSLHYYRRHMPVHTGEMPFQCKRCNRKFKWKSSLDSHMNSHFRKDNTTTESVCVIDTEEEME